MGRDFIDFILKKLFPNVSCLFNVVVVIFVLVTVFVFNKIKPIIACNILKILKMALLRKRPKMMPEENLKVEMQEMGLILSNLKVIQKYPATRSKRRKKAGSWKRRSWARCLNPLTMKEVEPGTLIRL